MSDAACSVLNQIAAANDLKVVSGLNLERGYG
jgi:hypothetical protein